MDTSYWKAVEKKLQKQRLSDKEVSLALKKIKDPDFKEEEEIEAEEKEIEAEEVVAKKRGRPAKLPE